MNRFILALLLGLFHFTLTVVPGFSQTNAEQDAESDPVLRVWVEQLGSEQFHQRKSATAKLIKAGPKAVPALVEAMASADLETIDRAVHCLSEIAMKQSPDNEEGAWGELLRLSRSAGSRATLSQAAIDEIRDARESQAVIMLARSGVTVGLDLFMVRAVSTPQMVVQIDENWSGELEPLRWLRWIQEIEFARVKGDAIRKEVIERLIEMPKLNTIAIVEGKVDANVIELLQRMQRVNSLEFRYVPLTPEMGDEIVKIPIRVSLNLMGTGIPVAKVEQMRTQLPGLHIDHRQGGFLGVQCYSGFNICRINEVLEGKPAEKAGLLPGDEILGIDDAAVTKFEDLQDAINQKVPGDEVEVLFRRGGVEQTVTLKLGKYGDE
ncbi:PDZ domain-containing protein [Novipirellula artificiosorum]|uniref:PDZ domain (Also known as DHR or GLGF) n=1 Tax=Novipirellula artificiosorum TaxID=2528016 RepID=A0A5C6E3N3_9BACT|nr:PDZ domain-containing protein [Novipirellula artificiosorum]TWU42587.1 PDZ domain (Also known as DHR or GLGF) [Novipirellula artificiosorum]